MTRALILGSILAAATLAGCASGTHSTTPSTSAPATPSRSDNPQACNAEQAEAAVGQKATPDLLENYRQQSGSPLARILRPRDVITMEYNPLRLNLRVDEQDMVTSVNCG